ncbi:hypothetical protein [Halocynthiibacter namhaensis]|uniref:hypothetical protein n=1 Tax=Halocynthiibacter namhaensis TaxID=1290553 RepID=UPI00057981F8|nr:hypothetical protein [Halocynthiibacter namhaensis]
MKTFFKRLPHFFIGLILLPLGFVTIWFGAYTALGHEIIVDSARRAASFNAIVGFLRDNLGAEITGYAFVIGGLAFIWGGFHNYHKKALITDGLE